MTEASPRPIPSYPVDQYGAVDFEGEHVPCAFGGQPGQLTAFVLIQGVCQIIGIPAEEEIARIQGHHLLADGLFLVPFHMLGPDARGIKRELPAITLQRLHTWLALIPPERVADDTLRARLITTQRELADVVYAYFGRRLLPAEMRTEDDPYLNPVQKQLYDKLEEAGQIADRLNQVEGQVGTLTEKVERLMITLSAGGEADNIDADQQEQLKAMIDILSHRYEEKHGKGTRGRLINDLKDQHGFRFYNTVRRQDWPALVRDCAQRFRQMHPGGTPLPRVFQLALQSVEQAALF